MKKGMTKFFMCILTAIIAVFCLVSCNQGGTTKAKLEFSNAEQIVMMIEETDGKATAFDALTSLKDQGLISFEYNESTYGAYITSINGKAEQILESTANSSKGYSWTLYTSDMQNAYTETTVTYGDVVCGLSAYGASSLVVKEGALYVWVYEYYDYAW